MAAIDLVYPALEEDKRKLAEPAQPQTQAAGAAQSGQERRSRNGLALVYEVIEVVEDEDSAPPLSVFYPPSSHPKPAQARPQCFARKSSLGYCPRHSSVLDKTTVNDLLTWLSWVETWASEAGEGGEVEELHERLQSQLQHYTEPSPAIVGMTAYAGVGPLLPLGSAREFLSLWFAKTDRMDSSAEDVGVKGGGWERKDRSSTAGTENCLFGLRHRSVLHCPPPAYDIRFPEELSPSQTAYRPVSTGSATSLPNVSAPAIVGSTKFPFKHRANVLDRVAVMVPSGWDSWGKIDVLRDGSDTALVEKGWKVRLSQSSCRLFFPPSRLTSPPPQSRQPYNQNFLSRQLDRLMKRPQPGPHQSFRHAASATSSSNVPFAANPGAGGFNNTAVGPMGGAAEDFSLPGVEKVMQEMEGQIGEGDDGKEGELKDKFARLGRRDGKAALGTPAPAMPNEALQSHADRTETSS
ncbi:hypothetical protein L202_00957 [Cryptococcus amylolentus CBS 6039]|uniref:Uncharacterized protein n=1 Tax=Cryptococcus amylolentus CBS 6039 TaxID=1295533 RepID=A0A1E3I1Y8_9TREE|nr:hypothetical protein L202_00957 [Cryptococcus amylolentus CBS 6039]ODN82660.1 hypothetical protein L202_00957 [Cryptococcus amylolentus CBS 6039]